MLMLLKRAREVFINFTLTMSFYWSYSHYPVDISTTAFSYSHAMQYHKLLNGTGVNACVLLHGQLLGVCVVFL